VLQYHMTWRYNLALIPFVTTQGKSASHICAITPK